MKINSINNTNFKGLFIDMTAQNGGKWKMVYHPYSWEGGMVNKEKIDIKKDLPMNEEIYIPMSGNEPEISKDILGTVSYYKYPDHINNGKTRRHIDVGQRYNREDSLKIFSRKLDEFRKMKLEACKELAERIKKAGADVFSYKYDYDEKSREHRGSIFGSDSHQAMDESVTRMENFVRKSIGDARDYVEISESLNNLESNQRNIREELYSIRNARESGKLIDFSEINIKETLEYLNNLLDKIAGKQLTIMDVDKYLVLPKESGDFKAMADTIMHRIYGYNIPKDYKLETFEPKYIAEAIKRYVHYNI